MTRPPSLVPDLGLFATERQPRALLRAQLLEEGFEVVATDRWTEMRRLLRPATRPTLAIVDLQGAPNPDRMLDDLAMIMKPRRVLVLTAMGTVLADEIKARGFRVLTRPIPISAIVEAAARAIKEDASKSQ